MPRINLPVVTALMSFFGSTAFGQSVISQLEQRLPPGPTRASSPTDATLATVSGYLGAELDDEGEQGRGVRVKSVKPGTPAEKSGLKTDDLITNIEGKPVANLDAYDAVAKGPPGTKLKMTVERNGRSLPLDVTLGIRPAAPSVNETQPGEATPPTLAQPATSPPTAPSLSSPALGPPTGAGSPTSPAVGASEPSQGSGIRAQLRDLPPPPGDTTSGAGLTTPSATSGGGASLGITVEPFVDRGGASTVPVRRGAIITQIRPGSPADAAGLKLGAVIVRIDSRQVDSADDLVAAVRAARPGQEVELTYFDGDRIDRKNVRLGPASAIVAPGGPSAMATPRSPATSGYGAPPAPGAAPPDGGLRFGGGGGRPLLQKIERAADNLGRPTGTTVYDPLAMAALQARVLELSDSIKALEERMRLLENKLGVSASTTTPGTPPAAPGFGPPAGSSPSTAPGFGPAPGPAGTVP
jgi:membrane-associated protease RseP (regulator of RpoE activity)